MKTFSQFIEEAKKAKPPEEVLNKISRAYGKSTEELILIHHIYPLVIFALIIFGCPQKKEIKELDLV